MSQHRRERRFGGERRPREERSREERSREERSRDRYQREPRMREPRYGGRGPHRPPADEGAMSLRLDPRHRDRLKRLAAEAGLRPGELVMQWVVERLEAGAATGPGVARQPRLDDLEARVRSLEDRVGALTAAATTTSPQPEEAGPGAIREEPAPGAVEPSSASRVPLHEEIGAILRERGPLTAAEIAAVVTERGHYRPPRSGRAVDAATINSRVSNPHYRDRFVRRDGRIALAET